MKEYDDTLGLSKRIKEMSVAERIVFWNKLPEKGKKSYRKNARRKFHKIWRKSKGRCYLCKEKTVSDHAVKVKHGNAKQYKKYWVKWIGSTGRVHIRKRGSIDHKIPLSLGGTNDPENLYLCCTQCNTIKSRWEYTWHNYHQTPKKLPCKFCGKVVTVQPSKPHSCVACYLKRYVDYTYGFRNDYY